MSIENSKIMGEIGALLLIICPLADSFAAVLGLAGFALLVVAFDGLADHYKDRGIFRNALNGGIVLILGAVVAVVVMFFAAVGMLTVLGITESGWFDPSAWQGINWAGFTDWSAMAPYIGVAMGGFAIFFVLSILAAVLIRKSLQSLAQKSGVAMFATSGAFLLAGAILTIVVVGVVLLWIALILLAVAFFRLSAEPARAPPVANA